MAMCLLSEEKIILQNWRNRIVKYRLGRKLHIIAICFIWNSPQILCDLLKKNKRNVFECLHRSQLISMVDGTVEHAIEMLQNTLTAKDFTHH